LADVESASLRDDAVSTYEIDCFVRDNRLVTIRRSRSPAVDAIWDQLAHSPALGSGGVDELTARLADVLTRRLVAVLDAFDDRFEELVERALAADPGIVSEVTAVRRDLSTVRRVASPQRETLDALRRSPSPLLSDAGRRRFSDAFDVATRASHGIEAARTSLAEVLDAYRGAEAGKATAVSRVLTIYAAVMLPLSIVTGFFGMNVPNIPGSDTAWAWWVILFGMGFITLVSLGVFVALGWIRRPSGRRAGRTLGLGLIEAARAPAHIAGAVYEISATPIRSRRRPRNDDHNEHT
jgi:magnesium transporter